MKNELLTGAGDGPSLTAIIVAFAIIAILTIANKTHKDRTKKCLPFAFALLAFSLIPDQVFAFNPMDHIGRQHGMGNPKDDMAFAVSIALIIGAAIIFILVRDKPIFMIGGIVLMAALLFLTSPGGYNKISDGIRSATGAQSFQDERQWMREHNPRHRHVRGED